MSCWFKFPGGWKVRKPQLRNQQEITTTMITRDFYFIFRICKSFVQGTHRQGLQGERVQMPVCKSHHANLLNMHAVWSASGHKLTSQCGLSRASEDMKYNLPLWCSSLCICMNLDVIHKYLKGHLHSQKPGQQEGSHCKCIVWKQNS